MHGSPQPRDPRSSRRPTPLRPSFFAWLAVPVVLYAAYRLYGTPYLIWSYDYYGTQADWSSRHYTRCTFVGAQGAVTTYPSDGKCPWVAFFHEKVAGQ